MMGAKQKVKLWSALIITLQAMSWACATSRSSPNTAQETGSTTHTVEPDWKPTQEAEAVDAAAFRRRGGGTGLGSKPPSCNHKCGGCAPCEAIQVPTISGNLGIQYANYEPESWKCKCGAYVYNP